ncbi:MAG: MobA/MobL family protein [Rhodospirillales bacterium]|nr:MobA/MobL family protein [Rhodospirillales bacterium]
MAIFHLSVKTVSRSTGRSAVAAAAYRAADTIEDRRTGMVHDFSRKHGVEFSEIALPADAPAWAHDRTELWNAAEASEKRMNATTAREYEIGIPAELPPELRKQAIREFSHWLTERHKVAVDIAIHLPGKDGDLRNHHAHLLTSTREIGPEGFGAKTRALDAKDTGPTLVKEIREKWEEIGNRFLEVANSNERIDSRSYKKRREEAEGLARVAETEGKQEVAEAAKRQAQDLDIQPTVHIGPDATKLERRNIPTQRGSLNRKIKAENAERQNGWARVRELSAEIAAMLAHEAQQIRDGMLAGIDRLRDAAAKLMPAQKASLAERLKAASAKLAEENAMKSSLKAASDRLSAEATVKGSKRGKADNSIEREFPSPKQGPGRGFTR